MNNPEQPQAAGPIPNQAAQQTDIQVANAAALRCPPSQTMRQNAKNTKLNKRHAPAIHSITMTRGPDRRSIMTGTATRGLPTSSCDSRDALCSSFLCWHKSVCHQSSVNTCTCHQSNMNTV